MGHTLNINIKYLDSTLINIEKEDGNFQYNKGDEVELYINPKDILQYEGNQHE